MSLDHIPPIVRAKTLTEFENAKLLHFLAAAARADLCAVPLGQTAGLTGANLTLFRAVAVERGFLDADDRVTPEGRSWTAAQFKPFTALLSQIETEDAVL